MIKKSQINTAAVYTIGIAAEMVGVSVHLLRVYEREGLIIPVKTPTGRRLYSDLEIQKVKCIRRMISEDGMNFAGLRRLLALVPCWLLRKCDHTDLSQCSAYRATDRPCWASEGKCAHPMASCRDCVVYQSIVDCEDVKKLIFKYENL
jgi:MerR family transcriptional regulator/heat shock protein HspR